MAEGIPDEAVEAFRDSWRSETDLDEFITDVAIRAGLEADAPLIVARELEKAARAIGEAADESTERAKRDAHDGPGAYGYAAGLHAAAARLHTLAARYDQTDGPGPHTAGPTAECGCPVETCPLSPGDPHA